jgi:hypothetical protein
MPNPLTNEGFVVGTVGLMDLRLLGVGSRNRSISELMRHTLPWTWIAFVVAAVCGALLFASKATTYYANIPFRMKMVCMALAGVNMLALHFLTGRDMNTWDRGPAPLQARIAAGISLSLWMVIVATGRWIGFTT